MGIFSFFRQERINFYREIEAPALAPGALKDYDLENTNRHLRKFAPFTNLQIINKNASCDVEVVLDYSQSKKLVVLANGTKAIRNQPFNSWSVKNTHATISTAAGDIIFELETLR